MNGSDDLETGLLSLDDGNKADALIGMINRSRMQIGPISGSWSLQATVDMPPHNCLPWREPRAQSSTGARKAETALRIAAATPVGRQCDIPFGSQDGARIRLPLVPHRERLGSRDIHGASGLRPPLFSEDRTSSKQPRSVIVVPAGVRRGGDPTTYGCRCWM
jgi:hypothetical protein